MSMFSGEEMKRIDKPSDGFRILQRKLRKKKESPYGILDNIEKYMNWFIPFVSSLFFVIIGISYKAEGSTILLGDIVALLGFILLFAALILALLSRLFLFHFNKLRSDAVIKIESWAMTFFKKYEIFMKKLEREQEVEPEIQKDLSDAFVRDTEEEVVELWELMSIGLLDAAASGLKDKLQKENDPEKEKEIIENEKLKQERKWGMKKGCGRWAILCFYYSNSLFLASLLAWFVFFVKELVICR
ncbi:MAG: hypothetical protein JW814_07190 [Candidatus Krumholzibacteriota bacterium]|nr:hypothetical protein [Candidatus Krumholzibacteriota bacterium]